MASEGEFSLCHTAALHVDPHPPICERVWSSAASVNIAKAQALKEQGNVHFKEGDYPKALACYHQARAPTRT